MNQRTKYRWALAMLFTLLALSTVRDASSLFSYPVAVGADGYYYVLQINQLLQNGHLYFASYTPLIFYALAALSAVTRNAVVAIKLGSIILNILLCMSIYVLVSSITRNRLLGVLGSAIAALSGMHFYMLVEFIKNLAGLVLLIWAAWCAIRAAKNHEDRWIATSVALFILALLSHVSIWVVAPALFALVSVAKLLLNREQSKILRLIGVFGIVFLMISPALLALQRFVQLPPWIGSELLMRPTWSIGLRSSAGKAEMLALLLTAPTILLLIVRHRPAATGNPFWHVVSAVALWSLLINLNPFLNHDVRQLGIIGRLDHLIYLQLAIILPALIWLSLRVNRKLAWILSAITFCFMAVSMAAPFPKGLQPWYLAERQQMIQALPEQRQQLGTNPLVIAQHGDEFVITSVLGIPAQQHFPTVSSGQSAYWLLHQVNPTTITPSTIVVTEEENGSGLILMKHDDLTQWLNTINEEERNRLFSQNPHLKKYVDDQTKISTQPLKLSR